MLETCARASQRRAVEGGRAAQATICERGREALGAYPHASHARGVPACHWLIVVDQAREGTLRWHREGESAARGKKRREGARVEKRSERSASRLAGARVLTSMVKTLEVFQLLMSSLNVRHAWCEKRCLKLVTRDTSHCPIGP